MAETKKYTITGTNIKHNGKLYEAGTLIELSDEEAAPLKKHLIEAAAAAEAKKKGK